MQKAHVCTARVSVDYLERTNAVKDDESSELECSRVCTRACIRACRYNKKNTRQTKFHIEKNTFASFILSYGKGKVALEAQLQLCSNE